MTTTTNLSLRQSNDAGDAVTALARDAGDKVAELRDDAKHQAATALGHADRFVDNATTSVGHGMETTASGIRNSAARVADGLEGAGQYLKQSDGGDIVSDIGAVIQRHPKMTLGIGIGVGFLVARGLTR